MASYTGVKDRLQNTLIRSWIDRMPPERRRHLLTSQLYFPHDSETRVARYFRYWLRRHFEDGCQRVVDILYPGQSVAVVRDAAFEENARNPNQMWDGRAGYNYHLYRLLKFANSYDRLMVNYRPLLVPAMQLLARKPIGAVIEIGTGTGFITYLLSKVANGNTRFFGFDICADLKPIRDILYPDFSGEFRAGYTEDVLKSVDPKIGKDETVLFLSYGTFHNIDPATADTIMATFAGFRDKVLVLSAETQDPQYAPEAQPDHLRAEFSDDPLFGAMPIYSHNYPALFGRHPFDQVVYSSAPMPKSVGRRPSENRVISVLGLKGLDLRLEPHEGKGLISVY